MNESKLVQLQAKWATKENFAPYGQVISAAENEKPYDEEDAQLVLDRGIPRFYIMRLRKTGSRFHHIARHVQCTQCLGAIAATDWLMGVAPPSPDAKPTVKDIVAFRIPGNCFIKLHLGSWHAGPLFDNPDSIDFYNLELSDTNINDFDTCNLLSTYNLTFEII